MHYYKRLYNVIYKLKYLELYLTFHIHEQGSAFSRRNRSERGSLHINHSTSRNSFSNISSAGCRILFRVAS